jgi:hypothetical protein
MRRWLKVFHHRVCLTYEAQCRHCGDLVFYVTEEELLRRRRAGVRNPFVPTSPPSIVAHDCRKFTARPVIHNGRKP